MIRWIFGLAVRFVRKLILATFQKFPEPKPEPEPTIDDICSVVKREGPLVDFKCGHRDHERPTFNFFGETANFSDEVSQARELCADCSLAKYRPFFIRCALCGHVIGPGFGVAIYADNAAFKKEWTTTVGEGDEAGVIGCLRSECGPDVRRHDGHWMGDHFEPFPPDSGVRLLRRMKKPMPPEVDNPRYRN
ncbi:MAG: hypothetical protein AAB467_01280 [Patescibacteria group bacterium]